MDDLFRWDQCACGTWGRTFVTTPTKKMAEDLTDYFQGNGCQGQYMHSSTYLRADGNHPQIAFGCSWCLWSGSPSGRTDVPEVSLVAILMRYFSVRTRADSHGRAACNSEGHVIMYAINYTQSLCKSHWWNIRRRKSRWLVMKNMVVHCKPSRRKSVTSFLLPRRQAKEDRISPPSNGKSARNWSRNWARSRSAWLWKLAAQTVIWCWKSRPWIR